MVDSSNGAHGSFFDPFCSASTFGFFNPKDPGTNLPPILSNVSHSPTFSLGQLGSSGIIGNGLCGLLNQQHSQQQQQHSMHSMNGGLGQLTGFGQGNKSPTYNNSHSPLFGGGPSSPTGFFGNSGNTNQFSYNSNKQQQFPITTFSIEDTIQGRTTNDSSMFNGRSNDAPIFNRSSSFNETPSMYNRNSQTSPMFSRSSSINESSSSMYNNRSSNDSSSMFSSNRNGVNDNSAFNSMDDLNISSWNGPYSSGSSSNGYGNSTSSHNNREPQGSFMTNTASTVTQREGPGAAGTVEGVNQGVRETGIIEKLLHSYGFIQCCERQARLFFHFSQFEGTIEHLKLGDPVEFEMTYDRRTGKPIASFVTKIGPEVVLSEERVSGTVTTELHHESNGELQGRISYENRGECFFLPYCLEDIEGNVSLATGDSVSFQIATNQRSGNLTARYVRLENPAQPVRYRGIVSSIKDNFGFIERADVAKEIFFHFSETRVHEGIVVGDNIEFNIQTRNGKEVASSISKLPFGTVIFEDIGVDVLKGQVLKPVDKSQPIALTAVPVPRSETMQGRLRYRGPDRQELEVVYGEKDQKGSFTMRHGDWVEFQLAVDRRDKQQRATNIHLLEESFVVSGERREEGVISTLKDGTGLITCAERDQNVSFNVSELLEFNRHPKLTEDVEFTIIPDPQSQVRQSAIRIRYLPPGSVQFEIPLSKNVPGVVVREPSTTWVSQEALAGIIPSLATLGLPANVTEKLIQNLSSSELMRQMSSAGAQEAGEPGVISYQLNGINGWQEETIVFHWKDCKHLKNIRIGTKVMFDIHQVRRTREIIGANIRSNNQEKFGDSGDDMSSANSQNPNQNPVGEVEQLPIRQPEPVRGASVEFHSNFPPLAQRVITPPTSDYQSSNENPMPSMSGSSESAKGSSSSLDEFEPPQTPGRYSPDSDGKSSTDSPPGNYGAIKYSVGEMNGAQKVPRFVMRGYIAALKDGFGFIETAAQDGEIFFHSSSLVGDFTCLDVGQEVEYVVSNKASMSGKNAADMVKPLPRGTICRPEVFPEILQGVVVRPVRGANPDQSEYMGLIEDAQGRGYSFGITSMLNKKEVVQANEVVEFQVDAESNAVNIRALRKKLRATVEAVKGLYGFLSYELDDGKKLFFHMSEVKDNLHLNPGDEVEFVILQNPRNGKSSACSVVKLSSSPSYNYYRRSSPPELPFTPGKPKFIRKQYFSIERNSGVSEPNDVSSPGFVLFANDTSSARASPCNRSLSPILPLLDLPISPSYPPPYQTNSFASGGETQRPERLLNRLSKLSVDESAPRLIVIRQPYGPDGTNGFNQPRTPRIPGIL